MADSARTHAERDEDPDARCASRRVQVPWIWRELAAGEAKWAALSARGAPSPKPNEATGPASGETESLDAMACGGRSRSRSEPPAQRLGWVFSLCQQHAGLQSDE